MYIQSQHKFDKQPREIDNILVLRTLVAESNLFLSSIILYSLKVFIKIYLNFFITKRKVLFILICSELSFTIETIMFSDFHRP